MAHPLPHRPFRRARPVRRLCAVALLATALLGTLLVSPAQAAVPTRQEWLAETGSTMYGSRIWLRERVAQPPAKGQATPVRYALNLDIDNTSLQTYYAPGLAVPATLRLATYAHTKGVAVLFNTGRRYDRLRSIKRSLREAGYVYARVCGRLPGESLTSGKQRCRQAFVDEGYTILANVGNRSTDFEGGNYERAYRLPDYDNQLG